MTVTARMGLTKPTTADAFSTQDIADNWDKIDRIPGIYACTASTRPTWGTAQAGRLIIETDTNLIWKWSGTAFSRTAPSGILKQANGSPARGSRLSDFATTITTPRIVCSVDNVVIPNGGRPLMLVTAWRRGDNPSSKFSAYVFRSAINGSAANNAGTMISQWVLSGDNGGAVGSQGQGGSFVTFEPDGLPAGQYGYSFQIDAPNGGTSTVRADAATPVEITIVEL